MNNLTSSILAAIFLFMASNHYVQSNISFNRSHDDNCNNETDKQKPTPPVIKHVLDNGFTVLIRPVDTRQKVAIQLIYGVGSKHEGSSERGIAHLIEHMLFKGTEKLSESDIWLITDKFSGYVNAVTSYDWTKMEFRLPISAWKIALPILADCMTNCTFKQELLNSELKAVVQELKMYRDDFPRTLFIEILSAMYPDHPYHFPVIGYKHDLWNSDAAKLKAFYKKHYVPNNAALVVVGKVNPEEVLTLAQNCFGQIPADPTYAQPEFYITKDLKTHTTTLYRDVEKPLLMLAYAIPGLKDRHDAIPSLISDVLYKGQTSRLYKKLIEGQLANSVNVSTADLIDADIFYIQCEPREPELIDQITQIITDELETIAHHGCTDEELHRLTKKFEKNYYGFLESNKDQAESISTSFIETGDENHPYLYYEEALKYHKNPHETNEKIKTYASKYLDPKLMHKGIVLPFPHKEVARWHVLQARAEDEDTRILSGKTRLSEIEPGKYVHTLSDEKKENTSFPKPHIMTLSNGITVLAYKTDHVPIIKFALRVKNSFYPYLLDNPMLHSCLSMMMNKSGTAKKSPDLLHKEFENAGISYKFLNPYDLSLNSYDLSADFVNKHLERAIELLGSLIMDPGFEEETLKKVKSELLSEYESSFDEEDKLSRELTHATVFVDPYAGDANIPNSISKITISDIKNAYQDIFSPDEAHLIFVGNFPNYDYLHGLLQASFGTWGGIQKPQPACYGFTFSNPTYTSHYINRDQVTVKIAGPSINRFDPDYPALQLYDQHLTSRLFTLREQTGAFYSISGSSRGQNACWCPRIASIATIVSLDRLEEVITLLKNFIRDDIESFDEEALNKARATLKENLNENYRDNKSMVNVFALLSTHGLPFDWFESLQTRINIITVDDVKRAVKRVFNETMSTILVGRIGAPDTCSSQPLTPHM